MVRTLLTMADADADADFRATFHSHILKLRNRDISHVLRILAAHAPAAVVRDHEDVTVEEARVTPAAWSALRAHATSAATARPCARCGAALPHLWAALRHACPAPAPRRCDFPCPFVEGTGADTTTLADHQATCPWACVPCHGCGRAFPRHQDHGPRCPARPTPCEGCGEVVPLCDMVKHARTCPAVQVACPNQGCRATVPRGQLDAHLFRCPERRVRCPWCKQEVRGAEAHAARCAARKVQCAQCGAAVAWGENGSGLRRHVFEHRMPAAVAAMACARACAAAGRAPCGPACARRASVSATPCATASGAARSVRRAARCGSWRHFTKEGCTADPCPHPLCLRQRALQLAGCHHAAALEGMDEHERVCPHRPVACPTCCEGPLGLEAMRAHAAAPRGCARGRPPGRQHGRGGARAARRHAENCAAGGAAGGCARCACGEVAAVAE